MNVAEAMALTEALDVLRMAEKYVRWSHQRNGTENERRDLERVTTMIRYLEKMNQKAR